MHRRMLSPVAIAATTLFVATSLAWVAPVAEAAPECTIKFYGTAGTNAWEQPANWSTGVVPGPSDVVCIADGFSVVHSTGATIVTNLLVDGTLVLSGGSLAAAETSHVNDLAVTGGSLLPGGDLSVTNTFAWASGTIGGAGTLIVGVAATGTMSDAGVKTLAGLLRNDGTLEWSAGEMQLASGGAGPHLDNHGTLIISGPITTTAATNEDTPRFTNRAGATIVKIGSETSYLGNDAATLVNDGTITVTAGELWVSAGTGTGSGSWSLAPGGLHLAGMGWDLTGNLSGSGTLTIAGTLRFSGAGRLGPLGRLVFDEAILDVDSSPAAPNSVGQLDLVEGIVTGDGDLTVTGSFSWGGGYLEGAGTLVIAPGATASLASADIKILGRHLRNEGTLTWSQGTLTTSSLGDRHPHLDNAGALAITGAVATNWASGTTPPLITNRTGATITKTGSGDATLGDHGSGFVNDGTITVSSGSLWLDVNLANLAAGALTGGTWQVVGSAILGIPNGAISTNNATIALDTNSAFVDQFHNSVLTYLSTNNGILRLTERDIAIGDPGESAATLMALLADPPPEPGSVFTNNGLIALDDGSVIGVNGDFVQSSTGRLELQISAAMPDGGYGYITASGAATLAGTISATLIGGYVPGASDELAVVDASSLSGAFTTVQGPFGVAYRAGTAYLLGSGPQAGCTVTWDGSAGDGWWDTASNWSTDAVPGPVDRACIPEGATATHRTGTSTVGAVTVDGSLTVTGGTLSLTDASTVDDLNVSGGSLTGDGALSVNHAMLWTAGNLRGAGTLTITAGATATINGTVALARHLRNDGTLTWQSGGIWLTDNDGGNAHLDNHATFTITNGTFATWSPNQPTPPQITNQPGATITKTTPGTTTLGSSGTNFTNNGTITVGSASDLAVGTTFTQGSTGRLSIAVAGTAPGSTHGRVRISGSATLGGTLAATLTGGFTPAAADRFVVVDAGTMTGSFATVEGPLVADYDTAQARVVLRAPDVTPVLPTVQIEAQQVPEAAGTMLVEVRGIGGNTPTTVPLVVTPGTAAAGVDYSTAATPATVTVLPDTTSFVSIAIVDDNLDEDDEVFTVSAGGASAPMSIADDDLAPKAVIDGLSITEGDGASINATLAVRLVDPLTGLLPQASGRTIVVNASTHDGTAVAPGDYTATDAVIQLSPGSTGATFSVPIIGDEIDEADETFTVTLTAVSNVTVDADESATVIIVDDDATGASGVAQQLETGGAALFEVLDDWGAAYDLDRAGPSPFELPGITDELASLYEPQDDLAALHSPFGGLDDDLGTLAGQLQVRGLTIDWVEGGVGGYPVPPTAPDIIQVRYTTTLSDLAEALGYSGDELNDDATGVLQGLASALGLDAELASSADLRVTLVVGVDETGFYVADESGLRLDVSATGTVSGTGTVAGVEGAQLHGPVTVSVSVHLQANGGAARLRAADLAGSPLAYLRPAASGTVGMSLDATIAPLALSWDATFTLAVAADFSTSITIDAALGATVTLPGVTAGGTPATFSLLGTFDGTAWTLTGHGDTGTSHAVGGHPLGTLDLSAVLSPTRLDGRLHGALHTVVGDAAVPVDVTLDGSFDHTSWQATGSAALGELTLGASPALVWLRGARADAAFGGDITAGTSSGGVTLAADVVVLLPEPGAPGIDPEGAARAEAVTASLDSGGNLTLHAGHLSGSIGDTIDFTVADVDVHIGPDLTGPLFTAATVTATIPSLNGLGVTFTGLHLDRDGRFGANAIDVASQGLLHTIGLGGIVPFDVTTVSVVFPDHRNLDRFDVTVTGSIDFAAMAALPFTPVIGLGGPPITPSSPPAENVVTFAVAVDSLAQGEVRPLELGPITVGFTNLAVGDVTIGAQLTLGGYHNGQFTSALSGTLSILGGLDDTVGATTVSVGGSLVVGASGSTLDLNATFNLSARFGEVAVTGATLQLALGISTDANLAFTITGPTLQGAGVDRVEIPFGDLMRLVATEVTLDLSPAPGQPLATFGGTPGDGSLAVELMNADVLSGWGGEAGNLAVGADGSVLLLPGFFVDITVPDGTQLGLPDWLPLRIDELGIRFPGVDLAQIPPGGLAIADLAAFALRLSGGIEATDTWPIAGSVDGLEVDLAKLVRGEFPITNLTGFKLGVEPFELVDGFEVGGGLELGTIRVDADPATGDQPQDVVYGRLFGEFSYDGLGAGIDLVISQYGPVLARLEVPLAIPIDGGTLGGVMLSSVEGGLKFGGPAFPDPQRPLDILHDPAFDTDFAVNEATIRASVEPAVQSKTLTWDAGFTLAMSGHLTHALAPGIVTGDVTLGANIGLTPGRQGLKLIGSGDISVWGMSYAGAALLIDLADPLAPVFDFAFETPQTGNPLSFLMPAQAQLEGSIDTTGLLAGFNLGVRAFIDRLSAGSLDVGQGFFVAATDALAADLEADHGRLLAQLVLDVNGDGIVSASEDAVVITGAQVVAAVAGHLGGSAVASGRIGQLFIADLLASAQRVLSGSGSFDLADVSTKADYVAFAQLLGAGHEAVAALSGVMRRAVMDAGDAFWSTIDPSFHLRGALQPIILGIPLGEPTHSVELIITKEGLGFGFDTSVVDIAQRLADSVVPFVGGAALQLMTLGLEDRLGMTVELPIGGVVEGLFGGSGLPTVDPMSGDWAIELRGGLAWADFEIGQMTGLVIGAGNQAYLDAHVQKLYEDPNAPLDPTRLPIQHQQHYDDLLAYGGILLNGRLLLPKLLTDPVDLLGSLNLAVPTNPLEMPQWVAAIADHLSQVAQPATVQLYLPGFGSVVTPAYDAATEAGRLVPTSSGRALATAVNRVFAAAYIEGTFDGTLLSVPFGSALVEARAGKLAVEGQLPLIGLRSRFELDVNPTAGASGTVPLPRAIATTTINEADVDAVLARFGLPPLISGVAGFNATFRAVSPGYDPTSTDPLLRNGGFELSSRLGIEGLVTDARFRLSVTPPSTGPLPDLIGEARVAQIGPLGGVVIRGATIGITQQGGRLSIAVDGTADVLGARAQVHGVLNPDLTGSLTVTFDSGGPRLAGFDVRTGWTLTLEREGGGLISTFNYDGQIGLPAWLSTATGQGRVHATGSVSTDGTVDLTLDVSALNLFGFALHDGTFRVVGDARSAQMVVDASMSFLGTTLDVNGSLALSARGPSGTLTMVLASGSALALGPVALKGALSLSVTPARAEVSATGTVDVPGLANGLGITGTLTSAGTGSLRLTAASLGLKGFSLTRLAGSPPPPLATITRAATSTSMTVDARFDFLGTSLDVDGDLTLSATGPSGSLALSYAGSANLPFGGWTLEGGVTMAVTPSAASIAVSSRLDIPGIASNLTTTGSLDTSLQGSMTVSAGSLRLGPAGSPFSIGGSFTLSRTGTPAVISLGAAGVSFTWTGVATFALGTFSIGSDGHFDATVPATTVTAGQLQLVLPASVLHVSAGAGVVQLQVGASSLTLTGIGTLSVPALNVDTSGSFSVTLASTHLGWSGLGLDGRLLFERQGGVFRLRVTGLGRATPARFTIPDFATISVDDFTISSNLTFDVAASTTRLGPSALSIRGASIRVRQTGTSLSTLKVRVTGGDLYLPVGNPIALPTLEIDGDATWSQTFTASGINLGPALRTSNNPSFTLSLSGGVLQLSLNSPLSVTVLSGSVGMSLRTLTVASNGTFNGSLRGQLRILGYLVASATYNVSLSNGVVRMQIPSGSPVSVDLGPVSASVSGSVYSDGTFRFDGSAAVDLTLAGVGLMGTATVRLRDSGLSGSFTGQACVVVCIDVVGGSISSRGVLTVRIAGIIYRVQLFDPPQ